MMTPFYDGFWFCLGELSLARIEESTQTGWGWINALTLKHQINNLIAMTSDTRINMSNPTVHPRVHPQIWWWPLFLMLSLTWTFSWRAGCTITSRLLLRIVFFMMESLPNFYDHLHDLDFVLASHHSHEQDHQSLKKSLILINLYI